MHLTHPLRSIRRKLQKARFYLGLCRFDRKEKTDLPRHIQLEPTVRCNLHCLTCSRDKVIDSYRNVDLSLEAIEKIISFFPRLKSIKLQGLGEPFLHPQIEEILKRFKQRNIRVWLISNGTLFSSEKYRSLVCNYVWDTAISFDSVDDKIFAELRGADIHTIIHGVKQLVIDRDRNNPDALIGINYVVSHKNYFELEKLYHLAADLKVDYVTIVDVENWMVPGEPGFEESKAFVTEAHTHALHIKKAVKKLHFRLLGKGILLAYKDSSRRVGSCFWPFKSLFVTVEGLVTPCCIRMHRQHALGDILKVRSLEEIWGSLQYRTLRQCHLAKDSSNIMCGRCPD